ncbi:FAD-dependent oxidoreductase [Sandaracinus amylolyticus]|uniref:FAD-dependent oxidoreductase n=1 Tax=Sandaracinus amylolyticus TaxID=927083 RepID=UPI001F2CD682|nr:NAD(P)/FAD-dependent oxidoreductase [Sandaracinus amylolyticus]UJR81169.1 FAD-dependent monooxygenase [Sandaracinus amylolyticus]
MPDRNEQPVVVVGAGPVGLFAALSLLARGVRPIVIEKRREPRPGSRSIGVHPPSLELLDALGLGGAFVARGVRVRRGRAFGASGEIGMVSFASCPGAHPYVLTIAQEDTESILAEALETRAPGALQRGVELVSITPRDHAVDLTVRDHDGTTRTIEAAAVIGCDGRRSATRSASSIASLGLTYEGAYAMVDVPDTTRFGDDAAIFLGAGGLVESFPLSRRWRRWVIRRDAEGQGDVTIEEIADTVERRTGHRLPRNEARAPSAFRAERALATELARGRVALAGDAAHVVSPIGGQGMNLGWRGAATLADALSGALARGDDPTIALAADATVRARAARAATRRAELNMWLGRPTARAADRDRVVTALLLQPVASVLARAFTMRGLEAGV